MKRGPVVPIFLAALSLLLGGCLSLPGRKKGTEARAGAPDKGGMTLQGGKSKATGVAGEGAPGSRTQILPATPGDWRSRWKSARHSLAARMHELLSQAREEEKAGSQETISLPLLDTVNLDEETPAIEFTPQQIRAAGAYADLLAGRAPVVARLERLSALMEQPDPEAEAALILVLQTTFDRLAPYAIEPLAQIPTRDARRAIRRALADPRIDIRCAALMAIVESGDTDAYGLALAKLEQDPATDVKIVASIGLGLLGDRRAVPALAAAANNGMPAQRLCAAWALWAVGDARGLRFLAEVADIDDFSLSPRALVLLGLMQDPAALPTLLSAMASRWPSIWQAAYRALLQTPPETAGAALDLGDLRRTQRAAAPGLAARRLLLLAVARARRYPSVAAELAREADFVRQGLEACASFGDRPEQLFLLAVLRESPTPLGLEALLRLLESTALEPEFRAGAAQALRVLAAEMQMTEDVPQSDAVPLWRRWWVLHSRAALARDAKDRELLVALRSPDGVLYAVATGLEVATGVRVLRAGAVDDPAGPWIEILCHNERFRLTGSDARRIAR